MFKKTLLAIVLLSLGFSINRVVLAKADHHTHSNASGHTTGPATAPIRNSGVNLGAIEVNNPGSFSKIYALSDVHGMYGNLIPLLQTAGIIDSQGRWSAGNSLLIVIGDSIDKGPQSIEVIDFWMGLMASAPRAGGAVVHLLGNHEAEFLADPTGPSVAKGLKQELSQKGIPLEQLYDPAYPRAQFLRSMPIAARVGTWMFAHSGFIEQNTFDQMASLAQPLLEAGNYSDSFFIGSTSILEAKEWWVTDSATRSQLEARLNASSLTGLVFGHQPSALNVQAADAISSDNRLIKVDNGMAPEAGANPGSVLVFENPGETANLFGATTLTTVHSGDPQHQAIQQEIAGAPQFPEKDTE